MIFKEFGMEGADVGIRKTPNSWIIFCHLIRILSLPNAARMLIERKFIGILRQTLEEAQKAASSASTVKDTTDDSVQNEDKPLKVSKKRKRSGELVTSVIGSDNHGIQLPTTIFAAIYHMVRFTKATSDISAGGRTAEFSAEYMKSVIRTPAEDAAKILGSWLSLCRTYFRTIQSSDMANMKSWLSPFIEIWDSRTVGNEDLGQFSLFCSQPLLSLLKAVKAGDAVVHWKDELEQLVARNIMIPAKADRTDNPDSQLLNTLTRISVIQDSANAPILFEVAIRSVQASGPQRRRANDGWLQPVFATLRGAMPPQRAQGSGKAIQDMLQSAIKYKIDLGLPTLRSVTWECCMLEGSTNWDLLGTVVKLDANIFLIPDEKDLLQQLLNRITSACVEPTWAELSNKTISDVLVPLMNGFAKARDLSSFIRHWYAQLVEFERLRKEARLFSMAVFSAWEDEAFQAEFSKIMEASLTVTQITQLLDWLSTQVTEAPDAVCVILQAVAGSITQVEFSDAVGLRPYDIMFSNAASEKLDGRYKWRSWRILSGTLNWKVPTNTDLEEISDLWEEHALPFDSLSSKFVKGSLLDVVNSNTVGLETIEAVRFTCAAWDASTKNSRLRSLCKKGALDILQSLAQDIKLLLPDLSSDQEIGEETCGSTLNTLFRGIGWMLWSSVHCVFFEYPEMLQ
jgi:nucleolar pre-ribosomal-associated protein 2